MLHTLLTVLSDPPTATQQLIAVLDRATRWLVGILVTVATLFATVGAVRLIWAGGDAQQAESAKRQIREALVGLALATIAPIVVAIVKSILIP